MNGKTGKVLVIGGGIGGMEASLNLVEAGFKVYLADRKPNIGGNMAQLDKIFPTNDCSMCVMAPKLVEVGRNPNIELVMNSEVVAIEGEVGNFTVTLRTRPRRVLPEKCTSCTLCAGSCPLEAGDVYNENLSKRSAAFVNFPQAIPSTYMIDRQLSPCIYACPLHLNARDYVNLIAEGRYFDALELIREKLPFPGIIGRICDHPCEGACLRGNAVDQPVAICALKRFVAEYEVEKKDVPTVPEVAEEKEQTVAIVGGGPTGVSCAIELRKAGYKVTIFDAYDKLGGMLYVGIPAYRLPKEVLHREFSIIEKMGVKVHYNTRVGKDMPLGEIFSTFHATFISSGAHGRRRLGIEHEDAEGVFNALNFLRDVNTEKSVSVGERVFVLGGGNVAMDTALTAKRCGGKEVTIVSLETWDEMPAHAWAINQALEEGVKIFNAWGPKRIIVKNGSVSGIEFQRCTRIFDEYGMFNPVYDGTTTRSFDADTIILVIYEIIDTAYLSQSPEIERLRDGRVKVDFVSLETSKKGVFAGGNVVTGPRTAINAIAHGLRAAESIKRYFEGRDLREGRLAEDDKILDEPPFPVAKKARAVIPEIPVSERNGFAEVNLALDEASAREEAQRCLSCRRCLGCRICEEACRPEAIDYSEAPVEQQINVGSVIISTGYDEFDAREMKEFGYGICKNVLTSVEYERVLSATGPTGSIVMRPSDGKIPGKIAFIQCVGSRNKINEYCSAVCCMYATEEAIISREHHHDLEPTIFYMDVRTFGKGYEQHFERARKEYGIKYVKSHISRVMEDNSTGDIDITFMDGKGAVTTGRFDLVVLSVGLRPSKHLGKLADVLGVELNEYGFVKTEPLNSFDASRKGIYVCGCSESPKDITETVIDGLGVATESALPIQGMRWKDIDKVLLPQEKDVNGETPRIGVFICNCGVNIGGIVDVPDVCRYASRLPNVVIADENLFTCSHDTQEKIKKMIDEHRLNRVVVASCSTRTHEPLFRALIRDAGLNKYLFEMANIRDQCSWVHMYEKDDATEKAKTLVRMAVANAGFLEPLRETSVPVHKSALVVGGGVAGMTAALDLAGQGIETCLVEQGDFLGGNLRNIFTTIDGVDIQGFLHDIIENVVKNPFITVKTNTCVAGSSGAKGNFVTELLSKDNACSSLNHGIILIATGGGELKPYGHYRYGEDARIMTQLEFERMIAMQPAKGMNVAMVQCVGSRNEGRPYCSRVCCATAIKNAITLKEKDPETGITIFFRDMMTYGFLEKYYLKARGLDIRFVRFDELSPPVLEESDGLLQMRCVDSSVAEEVSMKADAVVLSSAIIPANNEELSAVFKLPRTREGFFLEAHMKLKPVDFAADGIYMAGVCHSPKSIRESIAQAKGAVARALTILAKDMLEIGGVVARVEGEKCAACLTCVRVCPYSVPVINIKSEAEIDISKCKGCGSCAAECPAKAIDLMHYTDVQLTEKVKALCVGM